MRRVVKQLKEIEDESRERLGGKEHNGEVPALLVLMLFEAAENAARASNSTAAQEDARAGRWPQTDLRRHGGSL